MNGREKSDSAEVAVKPANKTGMPAAEQVEPRAGTEGQVRGLFNFLRAVAGYRPAPSCGSVG